MCRYHAYPCIPVTCSPTCPPCAPLPAAEFARVKGHFGPINSVMFHPDGASYASGGEDGYVRINVFDQPYFDFSFEC